MKFYLTKNIFSGEAELKQKNIATGKWPTYLQYKEVMLLTGITSMDDTKIQLEKCSKLKLQLEKIATSHIFDTENTLKERLWNSIALHLTISDKRSVDGDYFIGSLGIIGLVEKNCLQEISNLCILHKKPATARVKLTILGSDPENESLCTITTQEMQIGTTKSTYCDDAYVKFPISNFQNWKTDEYCMEILITVTVTDMILDHYPDSEKIHNAVTSKILGDEVFSDLTIIAGNGVAIKAHKVFLGSQSPVFQVMLQSDMKEGRESTVEISDMSEEVVRSFLDYLYFQSTKEASQNCEIAMELLMASHKYNINALEHAMCRLFIEKPAIWFKVDVAARLFQFAKNLTYFSSEEIEEKAVHVMKSHAKNLDESPTFKEMFKSDPGVALELCRNALLLTN